jgi:hypothetical protein
MQIQARCNWILQEWEDAVKFGIHGIFEPVLYVSALAMLDLALSKFIMKLTFTIF